VNTDTQCELIPTSPGDVLRHERLKQGLSLEQAALGSRISLKYLASIESNDTQHIPQVYLNGYVRNYARFLSIPADQMDRHLPYARGSEPAVQSVFTKALPKTPDDRWFKATSYVLASMVVIALVWQFTAEAVRFSQGDPVNPLSANRGAGLDGAMPTGSDSAITSKAPSPNTTHLQASIAPMEDVRRSRLAISGSGAESAWSAISQVAVTDESAGDMKPGEQSFGILASADSWVEIIDGNGNKIEMDLLRAGNGRNYVTLAPVRLLLGRASSIELTHNGQAVDLSPYTRGNVARITLTEDFQKENQAGGVLTTPEPAAGQPGEDAVTTDGQAKPDNLN